MEKLDVTQAHQDTEIEVLNNAVTRAEKDLELKLNKNDATRIWKHFQRFAEYNDLKELYSKCLPELAKFEQKIANFQLEYDKNQLVIGRFDEVVATKSSKNQIS